jgi:pilus assembly protein CpaC
MGRENMKYRKKFLATCSIWLALLPAIASARVQQPEAAPDATAARQSAQTQPLPQPSQPVRVMVGKSVLISSPERLRRVSVTDPSIADALVVTPNQILVHGRGPGEVSLIVWDEAENSRTYDLRVDVDITAAAEEIKRIFPDQAIKVSPSRNAVVLSGHVATKEDAERANLIAAAYSRSVVNVLTFGPVGAQEVLLEVKFAEVNRTAITQLGANFFSTGLGNTIGTTSTQQFGGSAQQQVSDAIGKSATGFQSNLVINDPLNVFLFRPDIHLGVVIKALQQKNLLEILAEPNLIALNGKEASFLAGGEFPFPVVQPSQGSNAITIQFKEFGVRLRFTPVITPNGNIHLQVKPEVSALDFANGLTIAGFTVPALSTRRAETEFEIQDGQSFVIAGLMDNRVTNLASKVPGLGNLPILGNLFRSKNLQKNKTELMVLVTAHRVSPSAQPTAIPKFPMPFLEEKEKKPSGGAL